MHGTRYPNAEEHPPQAPLQKGGKERSKGGMLSLQRGNAVRSAVSIQYSANN
ncbi:hypothetical protein TFUB4_02382 [Tannerella forsythia]|nr:hypothetical protein TFUB4_02382 [Tannerella forsythia]